MGKKAKAGNLINRGGKWVYRVFYRINGVKKEKQITLRTPSLVTARERSVLILNAQGQTAREISELLGFSINTALSHLSRAKKSFGACIDSEGEYA